MLDKMREEWTRRHLEGFKKALYWPAWYFLPHGADKDRSRNLRQRMFGIVFFDRQLVRNEKDNPPC